MQKKSLGTWVLLFCFVLSLLAFPVSAVTDSAQVGTWKWSYDSSTATLTISGTGKVEGYPPGSTEGYMKYVADIRHLVIDEGITEIGESSFPKSLYYLESIRIADSVETIGMNAFANNFYVTEIHLGKGIKTIGEAAFTTCEKVESLVLSAGLQSIGAEAFSHCGMKELVIPGGIAVIEDGAFRGCSNLTKVYIPAGVTQIKYAAFRDSDKITDVYFGGTEAQWKAIDIDQTMDGKGGSNAALQTATIHYNHTSAWEEETPSTQPTTPAEPVTPTEPVSPTEPVTPTEPSTPTQPENEQNGNVAPTEQTPTQENTDAENQTNASTENPAADDEKEEPAPFPWVAVCIGAAVLLAAAGVIVWLRVKKRA